jgi:hypothetical protein
MRFGFTAPLERRAGCDVSVSYRAPNIPGGIGDIGASGSSGSSIDSPTSIFYIRRTSQDALRNVPASKLTLREFVP